MNATLVKECFVGIDVSKDTLDIYVHPNGDSWTVANSEAGYKEICTLLKPFSPRLIVLEPTGGYEEGVLNTLIREEFRVSREHALKIHHHARGSGQLAKTDRLDAKMMAHYAQCYADRIEPAKLPDSNWKLLEQLVSRRRQLVEMRASEKTRAQTANLEEEIIKDCEESITQMTQRINNLEQKISELIESDEVLKKGKEILESVPCVGEIVSTSLLVYLPRVR